MKLEDLFLAAQDGIPEAQYTMAICYENGIGFDKDKCEAERWYMRSAQQGFAAAQYEYSKMLVAENTERLVESVEWLQKAADQGFRPAQFLLSLYCEGGVGVPVDLAESFRLSALAASQGYCPAARRTALMLEEGRGVAVNLEQAFYWYGKAAELGDADAASSVGRMYADGIGVEKNDDKAMEWLLRGAERGSPWACMTLASIFRFGTLGQSIDKGRATELSAKALELMKHRVPKIAETDNSVGHIHNSADSDPKEPHD